MVKVLKCSNCGCTDIIKQIIKIEKYDMSLYSDESPHYTLNDSYIDEVYYECTYCYHRSKYINTFINEK